jgi:hypothetical protein
MIMVVPEKAVLAMAGAIGTVITCTLMFSALFQITFFFYLACTCTSAGTDLKVEQKNKP